jgi:eukaryotic-like serine/threonine-protein kinase
VAALSWSRDHLLTVTVAGLSISVLGLVTPFLLRKIDRRDAVTQQRRARDRLVMLARVRHRWISGVLDRPDLRQVKFDLGVRRRVLGPGQRIAQRFEREELTWVDVVGGSPSISGMFHTAGGAVLILGEPGAGKTTALLEIARELLERAEKDQDQQIPVVFNLSTWPVRRLNLTDWLIEELHTSYNVPRRIGSLWLASRDILPLLDGLDEVAEPYRAQCVETINHFMREYGLIRVAVCCRTAEYYSLTRALLAEEVLELLAPPRAKVEEYLACAGAGLADVAKALRQDPALWELIRSPLVLNIVALTYSGRRADALRVQGSKEERLALLFEAYTKRMLDHRPSVYSKLDTRRWLSWLAISMHRRQLSEFHLDRLRPDWLPVEMSRRLATYSPALVVGVLSASAAGGLLGIAEGLTFGIFFVLVFGPPRSRVVHDAWTSGIPGGVRVGFAVALVLGIIPGLLAGQVATGLVEGLFLGLFGGLMFQLRRMEPAEEVGWVTRRALLGLAVGLIGGLVCGSAYTIASPRIGALQGVVLGLSLGVAVGLLYGLAPQLTQERTFPNEGIHRSARHAAVIGVFFGLIFAIPFWMIFGTREALAYELFFGASAALIFGGIACLQHLAIRVLLRTHGVAPLRYVKLPK